MIMNLFGTEHISADGLRSGTGAGFFSSPEVDIEIDSRPDLDELRQASENAER
ncbi:MAG: hypothetical protein ACU84Q_07790 [Gammaproteobacteria bacterium]